VSESKPKSKSKIKPSVTQKFYIGNSNVNIDALSTRFNKRYNVKLVNQTDTQYVFEGPVNRIILQRIN
jgi:hypothetical protein